MVNKVINRQSKRCENYLAKIYNKKKVENRPSLEQLLDDKKNMSMVKFVKNMEFLIIIFVSGLRIIKSKKVLLKLL